MNSRRVTDYLDPAVVSQLDRLDLIARLVVEGFITGLHQSPYHGFSVEFSEYRQYIPGDPIRNLDWKVWGRTDRLFVKQFEEETNLKAYLVLDSSASMAYGSAEVTKHRYATLMSAALGHLMLRQRDAVGLVTFDSQLRSLLPPRSVGSHLHTLLRSIEDITPDGSDTDLADTFHSLAEQIRRRALIIVLSDLLDDTDRVIDGLKHFRHRNHEVIVFHLLDPREYDLAFDRETVFVDLETGTRVATEPWQIATEYRAEVNARHEKLQQQCREAYVDYVRLDTQTPFNVALSNYLAKRKKLL